MPEARIEEAAELLEDGLKDVKDYSSHILLQIDVLKRLVHAELRATKGDMAANKALADMLLLLIQSVSHLLHQFQQSRG